LGPRREEGIVKPAPFEYHAPESLTDVVGLLAEHGDEAKPLAGGQSLVPMLALRLARFEHLVDLNRVADLQRIDRENGTLVVGAMARQAAVEHDQSVADAVPLLARAVPLIGHFQIRNRGTIGGSIAHADPASELPAVALTLDAEMEVVGASGTRRVPASDFFVGTWTSSIEPDEVLAAVRFPVWQGKAGFAIEEIARRSGDFALTGATCAVADGRAAIGLFGMGHTPVRASNDAEAAAAQGAPPREVGELAVRDLEPPDDVHASGRYRKQVGARMVERALVRAREEAGLV
jgi:carbon-monoxide dehydrogenase medium subunit